MKFALLVLLAAVAITSAQLIPNCQTNFPPHDPPTDVRHLRANDISLMMAMGDSIVISIIHFLILCAKGDIELSLHSPQLISCNCTAIHHRFFVRLLVLEPVILIL
jgi:hypothetical protein